MNNEPVAWTNQYNLKANKEDKCGQFWDKPYFDGDIPLYTHPVNPYKAITNTKIEPTVVSYTHPVKELTDEEILKMAADMFHYSEYRLVIDFARAIMKRCGIISGTDK